MLPVFDLILVLVSLCAFGFIGFYFRPKKEATSSDYFLARRRMAVIPAAFSISVSFLSSSALVIYTGEIALFACPLYANILSTLISGIVATKFVLHKLYDSQHLSVFQFFEHRFSRSVRILNSLIFVFTGLVNMAVVGYAVAIAAEVLAGIPFWVSAVTAGLLSTAYSTLGGIKAVIWTDVCQALLMILYLLLICIKVLTSFESFGELTTLISNGQRAKLRFSESYDNRYSFQSFSMYLLMTYTYRECVSQPAVQRWRSVKTLTDAKWTVIVSCAFSAFFSCLLFATGLFLYAFYSRCATTEGPFPTSEKISLYFVLNEMSSWPGAQGVCLIGVLSGALSTLSSFLNSLAAVTLEDFVKMRFKSLSDTHELTVSKALTAMYGIVSTALIFVASRSPAIAIVQVVALSISTGPPLGTFFLAMWAKRSNALGVSLGLGASVVLVTWLSIGSALQGNRHRPLPSPQCPANTTSLVGIIERGILGRLPVAEDLAQRGILDRIYGVSAFWYSFISFLASFCLGYLFSICIARFRRGRNYSEDETVACDEDGKPSQPKDISASLLPRLSQNCKVSDDKHDMEMCALELKNQAT